MNLKRLTDKALLIRIIDYVERCIELMKEISQYIETGYNTSTESERIKAKYKQLKDEIKKEDKNISLDKTEEGSVFYESIYKPSIQEAAAYGFVVKSNGKVSSEMHSAVYEARNRLCCCCSFEQLKHKLEEVSNAEME